MTVDVSAVVTLCVDTMAVDVSAVVTLCVDAIAVDVSAVVTLCVDAMAVDVSAVVTLLFVCSGTQHLESGRRRGRNDAGNRSRYHNHHVSTAESHRSTAAVLNHK